MSLAKFASIPCYCSSVLSPPYSYTLPLRNLRFWSNTSQAMVVGSSQFQLTASDSGSFALAFSYPSKFAHKPWYTVAFGFLSLDHLWIYRNLFEQLVWLKTSTRQVCRSLYLYSEPYSLVLLWGAKFSSRYTLKLCLRSRHPTVCHTVSYNVSSSEC